MRDGGGDIIQVNTCTVDNTPDNVVDSNPDTIDITPENDTDDEDTFESMLLIDVIDHENDMYTGKGVEPDWMCDKEVDLTFS